MFVKKDLTKPNSTNEDHLHNEHGAASSDEDVYYSLDELIEENVYKLKQSRAYLSIAFSLTQTIVLIAMMVRCSIAPFRINPMLGL